MQSGRQTPVDPPNQEHVGRFLVSSVSNMEMQTTSKLSPITPHSSKRRFKWANMLDFRRNPSETGTPRSSSQHGDIKTNLTLYEDDLRDGNKVRTALKALDEATEEKKANLGTFLGVFLPCCQNIVGVIYFVRFPWIVGTAGIIQALIIVGLCCLVSFCTAISISAIATNGKVTAGGTYFMISRSLGPGCGGSVGILFFLGTSISVAMYYIGTVETLLNYIAPMMAIFGTGKQEDDGRYHDFRVYGSALLVMMATVVFIGVTCVQRFGLFAILFLVAGLVSIFVGFFMPRDGYMMACKLGNRLMIHNLVYVNGVWHCNKDKGGPIYRAYCSENGTCEEFFENQETQLINAITGLSIKNLKATLYERYTELDKIPGTDVEANQNREVVNDLTTSFVTLMGIYFPSITGVESGSNYSGDLKNPHISIPLGTLLAVTFTTIIYLSSVIFFAGAVDSDVLRDKYGKSVSAHGELMISLMAWPSKWVVLLGTLTATIGAGLQALAGGPRLLQAISEDAIFPYTSFFAKTWNGEPRRCLALTFLIALTGILIARLDNVANIVTMFFLMCYGFVNFAVTLQSLLDLPHWRPSFHFYHWTVTLLGTALCITMMFLTRWVYALVAIILAFCLYQYIEYKGAEKEWGDGMTGLSMSAAIFALSRLKRTYHHPKNWRPQLLVLLKSVDSDSSGFAEDDLALVHLSSMLQAGGRGLCVYGTVIPDKLSTQACNLPEVKRVYGSLLDNCGVKGFAEVVVAPNVSEGISYMLQSAGLGPLRPNTIVLGWPREWMLHRDILSYNVFIETMRNIALTENAVLLLKADTFPTTSDRMSGSIDVWWIVNDGGMLLLLAHLLTRHKTWSRCGLRVFAVAEEEENTTLFQATLKKYLVDLRVNAKVEVVEMKSRDISAYVYEATLKMEERTRLLEMLVKNNKKQREKQLHPTPSYRRSSFDMNPTMKTRDIGQDEVMVPSEKNVRDMKTAIQLNNLMKEKSSDARLIILNLPNAPESTHGQANYMSFLEVLTADLDRLLLVRGTGSEVITIFN